MPVRQTPPPRLIFCRRAKLITSTLCRRSRYGDAQHQTPLPRQSSQKFSARPLCVAPRPDGTRTRPPLRLTPIRRRLTLERRRVPFAELNRRAVRSMRLTRRRGKGVPPRTTTWPTRRLRNPPALVVATRLTYRVVPSTTKTTIPYLFVYPRNSVGLFRKWEPQIGGKICAVFCTVFFALNWGFGGAFSGGVFESPFAFSAPNGGCPPTNAS